MKTTIQTTLFVLFMLLMGASAEKVKVEPRMTFRKLVTRSIESPIRTAPSSLNTPMNDLHPRRIQPQRMAKYPESPQSYHVKEKGVPWIHYLESELHHLAELQKDRIRLNLSNVEVEGVQIMLMDRYREYLVFRTQDVSKEEYEGYWRHLVSQQSRMLKQVESDASFSVSLKNAATRNLEEYRKLDERISKLLGKPHSS